MTPVVVLGAGPAAAVTAILLRRMGHWVRVIGQVRQRSIMEGASPRVAEGLARAQCHNALAILGERWQRVAAWGGECREVNGEYVIDRRRLNEALWLDMMAADVEVVDARALKVVREGGGWRGIAESYERRRIDFTARFLVEARGRSAPKLLPDVFAGPLGMALTRSFSIEPISIPRTFTESFNDGWAWATASSDGCCTVQVTLDHSHLEQCYKRSMDLLHETLCSRLSLIPSELGSLVPIGHVRARGVQPVLRGRLIDNHQLRVGDAAYSCDPLSGHGMYEAVSGAFAAAPTVNTILRRPDLVELAKKFYLERAHALFYQRLRTAGEFYQEEARWAERVFWHARSQCAHSSQTGSEITKPRVESMAVVENGLIVKKEVVVTPEYPRGVRFVGGIELVSLLNADKAMERLDVLARRFSCSPRQVARALQFLRRNSII